MTENELKEQEKEFESNLKKFLADNKIFIENHFKCGSLLDEIFCQCEGNVCNYWDVFYAMIKKLEKQ